MTPELLSTFFGWLTIVNFAILALAGLSMFLMQNSMAPMHERIFNLQPGETRRIYFGWLGTYKLLTLVFCFAPWLALQIAF